MISPMDTYPKALQYVPLQRSKRISSILKTMDDYSHEELLLLAKDLRSILLNQLSDVELEQVYNRECEWETFQVKLAKLLGETNE